jgi:hypothetical protein
MQQVSSHVSSVEDILPILPCIALQCKRWCCAACLPAEAWGFSAGVLGMVVVLPCATPPMALRVTGLVLGAVSLSCACAGKCSYTSLVIGSGSGMNEDERWQEQPDQAGVLGGSWWPARAAWPCSHCA